MSICVGASTQYPPLTKNTALALWTNDDSSVSTTALPISTTVFSLFIEKRFPGWRLLGRAQFSRVAHSRRVDAILHNTQHASLAWTLPRPRICLALYLLSSRVRYPGSLDCMCGWNLGMYVGSWKFKGVPSLAGSFFFFFLFPAQRLGVEAPSPPITTHAGCSAAATSVHPLQAPGSHRHHGVMPRLSTRDDWESHDNFSVGFRSMW